jgi:hypothetical protein
MPCERKSVEPMAAITAPERTAAQHQSLLHFISEGRWSDEKVLAKVRELVLPELRSSEQETKVYDTVRLWRRQGTTHPVLPKNKEHATECTPLGLAVIHCTAPGANRSDKSVAVKAPPSHG